MALEVLKGGARPASILSDEDNLLLFDWSADGRYILFNKIDLGNAARSLVCRKRFGWIVVKTGAISDRASQGRCGHVFTGWATRCLRFELRTGRFEIYVTTFPNASQVLRISRRKGGPSLAGPATVWRSSTSKARPSSPCRYLPMPSSSTASRWSYSVYPALGRGFNRPEYDVSADGRRFVIQEKVGEAPVPGDPGGPEHGRRGWNSDRSSKLPTQICRLSLVIYFQQFIRIQDHL